MEMRRLCYRLNCFHWEYSPDPLTDYQTPPGLLTYLRALPSAGRPPGFILRSGYLHGLAATPEVLEAIERYSESGAKWAVDTSLDIWTRRLHVVDYQSTGLEMRFMIMHTWE